MERVIQSVVLGKKLHSGGHSVTSNGLKKILFHPCLIVDQPAAATAARITTIAVNRGRRACSAPTATRVANCFEFKVAHYLAKKRTKRSTSFFNPKSAIILTPQTIFIAFLCINFFQMVNLSIFSCFF